MRAIQSGVTVLWEFLVVVQFHQMAFAQVFQYDAVMCMWRHTIYDTLLLDCYFHPTVFEVQYE